MIRMQWVSKLMFYMRGRYGYDELSKVLILAGLITSIFSNFTDGFILNILALALISFGGLRVVSKEKNNRLKELKKYIDFKQVILSRFRKYRNRWFQRKAFKITKCPNCKQKIRIPRGRKKVRVTCPSCKNKFIKKT
ncbi:BRcat domain-containing protein [Alkalibacterium gilvum]|uniref:BRcat domain-containing protein n=1 Tax=Alkalibacterium gilvum TaxID=1130080 RepID=UPI00264F2B69|nr:zinc-ribbon domain-containing protein [Alkalibacterium sp.]